MSVRRCYLTLVPILVTLPCGWLMVGHYSYIYFNIIGTNTAFTIDSLEDNLYGIDSKYYYVLAE